jgi:diguanylate cyclase (GGDEF)-like protein
VPRFARPELWLFAGLLVAETAIAAGVVLADRVGDGGLVLLLWPMVGVTARMPLRAVLASGGWCIALIVAAWTASDAGGMLTDPIPVITSVGIGLTVVLLVSTLRDSDTANHAAATSDPLTGLLNRGALDARVDELERITGPLHRSLAVVVAEVEHFKRINDEHGHAAGDDVLRDLARRIESQLRLGDELYRLGGEEFVALLPATTEAEARHVAERLVHAVGSRPLGGLTVTVSAGVAASPPDDAFAWRTLFRRADAALYAAKEDGRDCVRVRSPEVATVAG